MVIDAAKGIEPQTLKLFEVCRLRDIPIITFVNKLDREARDTFEIIAEIEDKLALDVIPMQWPAASGRRFRGVSDLRTGQFLKFATKDSGEAHEWTPIDGNSIGQCIKAGQKTEMLPTSKEVTGFVFKVQANMDLNHRDRVAFLRLCSGEFKRGMKMKTAGGKAITVHNPVMFFAQDREIAENAYAGDVIGIPNHGALLSIYAKPSNPSPKKVSRSFSSPPLAQI